MSISFRHLMSRINGKKYKRIDTRGKRSHSRPGVSHGASGKHVTQFDKAHFICWDGEGIDDPRRPDLIEYNDDGSIKSTTVFQLYALLMNNEGAAEINTDGLSTEKCLETILNWSDDKQAIHVCFGASYDINMFLRDVPEKLLRLLHAGKSIDYGKYQLKYRQHKSLEIREYMTVHRKRIFDPQSKKWHGWYKKSVTLWDVFSFFQLSFIETLDKWFVRGNRLPEEAEQWRNIIAEIKKGKDARGTFTKSQLVQFIMPYCKLEVDALHSLMMMLHSYLKEAGIQVSRWDGAGACASALLKKYGVKPHISEKEIPSQVVQAAEYAFFGGRIETLLYGNYEGDIYHDDISSAYPDELSRLPSLQKGLWWNRKGPLSKKDIKDTQQISLFKISWIMRYDSIIAPFPWRAQNGTVFFPVRGKSWVYKPELEMALDCFNKGQYKCKIYVEEVWEYFPGTDEKPFAFIKELFEFRKYLISIGSGAEKVIKLALNSFYGKTAQSIGYNDEKGQKPPYHNMIIAGMVTSGTRAKMMRAAMQCPDRIIMLATDGIYSLKKLDVPVSKEKELGTWEEVVHDYITVVASGVYWYANNGDETAYSRGFNKFSILRDRVLEAWNQGENNLDCTTTRFVGIGSAIGLNDFKYWCTWRTVNRQLGLDTSKVPKRYEIPGKNPSQGLVRTYVRSPEKLELAVTIMDGFPYNDFAMSHKYKFRWDTSQMVEKIDGIGQREYLDEVANTLA